MFDLQLFDANCYTGRYRAFRPGSFYTLSGLIEQMDYYGISEALVTHSLAREHHPADGNQALMEEVGGEDRVHPVWALLPSASREIPPPAQLVPDMISRGVKAARLFYGSYRFSLSDWCIGDVLDVLEAYRVPTFIDPDSEIDVIGPDPFDGDSIDSLCRKHPDLPVILTAGSFYTANRLLYQLFEHNPNFCIELSGLWAHRGIEFIVREFGAGRILFGTGLPLRDPGSVIAQLTYSEISDEEKLMIAGRNLRELLGGVVT